MHNKFFQQIDGHVCSVYENKAVVKFTTVFPEYPDQEYVFETTPFQQSMRVGAHIRLTIEEL